MSPPGHPKGEYRRAQPEGTPVSAQALDMSIALERPGPACAQAWRTRPYREALQLRDGRRVTLRPAHRSDAGALQAFFAALSPRSRLMRFHGVVNRIPDGVLRDFTTQVPQRHVALVAMTETDDGLPALLAEARYVVDADTRCAEFALAVADDWQGQGLGRALLQRLALHARAEGLAMLEGSVRPDNEPVLALVRGLGATLHPRGPELWARFAW